MCFRLLCTLGLLVALCFGVGGVSATPTDTDVTILITAIVAYVDDPWGLLHSQIHVNDMVTGSYTYNLATPNTGSIPQVGDYWHYEPPYGISVEVNGLVFQTDPDPNRTQFLVELVNDYYSDNYLLRSYHNLPLSEEVMVSHIAWQLDDPTMTALSNVALPAIEPDLTAWQSIFGLTLEGCTPDPWLPSECSNHQFFVRAHITSAVRQYCPNFVPPTSIGIEDIMAIATRWGWTNSTPGWDPRYDLNGDNTISVVDITLVTRVWGSTCS